MKSRASTIHYNGVTTQGGETEELTENRPLVQVSVSLDNDDASILPCNPAFQNWQSFAC